MVIGLAWKAGFYRNILPGFITRKEIVIKDIRYCPCRVSVSGACGTIKKNIAGETFECGVDAHLIFCTSKGCDGSGDLIDAEELDRIQGVS